MSVKAKMMRDATGNIVVYMQGDLNYDQSYPLREELFHLTKANPHLSITLDLGGVDFVGSSGICHFVETLRFLKEEEQINICLKNVKNEFLRVFKLYSLNEADYVADLINFDTDETSTLAQNFAKRDVTFEN